MCATCFTEVKLFSQTVPFLNQCFILYTLKKKQEEEVYISNAFIKGAFVPEERFHNYCRKITLGQNLVLGGKFLYRSQNYPVQKPIREKH